MQSITIHPDVEEQGVLVSAFHDSFRAGRFYSEQIGDGSLFLCRLEAGHLLLFTNVSSGLVWPGPKKRDRMISLTKLHCSNVSSFASHNVGPLFLLISLLI